MSYIVPSVQVYEELQNSGGVANSTPDLEACVIGAAYSVINYVSGSIPSLVKTAATSSVTAVGSIVSGSTSLTFATIPAFTTGDTLLVPGASSDGNTLQAKVTAALGNTLTLDTAAGTSVTEVVVRKQGLLVNPLVNNSFNLPTQTVGQIVNVPSIQVYANAALVETFSTGFNGYPLSNVLTFSSASGTATTVAASAVVTVNTNATQYVVGDTISIATAGVAGAALVAKILVIAGSSFTLSVAATSTVTAQAMTKTSLSNVSTLTSTLMLEAGDKVIMSYTDVNAVAQNQESSAISVVAATGNLTNISSADVLPATAALNTTSTTICSAGASTIVLTSVAGLVVGDTIKIAGAGTSGSDLEVVVSNIATLTATFSPVTVTTVPSGTIVKKRVLITFKTRKLFNNQLIPATKPFSGGANYSTTTTGTDGVVVLNAGPELPFGKLISSTIHMAYKALRTDLSGGVITINDANDALGIFGEISELNPLALGVSIALANTTTRVRAIAIPTDDNAGYARGLELAESERLYAVVPLTQDVSVCQQFNLHAQQMSTPENALWRVALVNTLIPTVVPVGSYTSTIVNANSGNNAIASVVGKWILTSSNSTFISDNVVPGDTLIVTAGSSQIGSMQVLNVISNQQIEVQATGVATGVSFYISRTLSKTQRAAAVAAASKTFGSNRLIHVQPDTVVVNLNGRKVVQPGYFLACALAGLICGFPSQQGFTNIGIAGISDLSNSNFTFTRAQLNTMAEAGTHIFVQETNGSVPYVRHSITTDVTVLEYRELQVVKNWDFLAYFYHDKLGGFIGKWNITSDTMGVIRQTIMASSDLVKSKKLPRIGAPLVDAKIELLGQNKFNKDQLDCRLKIQVPYVLNYLNLYLVI